MALPFWRTLPDEQGPNIITSQSKAADVWASPLINSRSYPGQWVCQDAPDLTLHEVFAKAENKDAQVRRVLGLNAPEFTFEVTLLDPADWQRWQERKKELLPVEKADGRGEVKAISHPDVNAEGVHYAYVRSIKPVKNPRAGGAKVYHVIFRAWWPAQAAARNGKAGKNLKDAKKTTQGATPLVDLAAAVPEAPSLAPTPSRLR